MDISSILGGLAGLGGSVWSTQQNIASAREQMDFQERMYKNRHTYEVADLKRAGLNPILSATSGGGSSPSGASATNSDNPGEAGVRGFSAMNQAKVNREQLAIQRDVADSQIALNSAAAAKNLAESDDIKLKNSSEYWSHSTGLMGSSADVNRATIGLTAVQKEKMLQDVQESKARISQIEANASHLREEIPLLRQRVSESRSASARNYAQAELDRAYSRLSESEKSLTEERINTQRHLTGVARSDEFSHELGARDTELEFNRKRQPVQGFFRKYAPRLSDFGFQR